MNKIELINGVFTVADAREVLFNLLQEKIKFHNRRIFGLSERLGVDDTHSRKG
ncbi:MAG: hypothetical protein R2795_08790 [Saprospiraceae bacterium]